MKCFYHSSDHDGHCSGAIIKLFNKNCELIPYNYRKKVDVNRIDPGETVYIADVSFLPEVMLEVKRKANIIWIDHHKTSIDESIQHGYDDLPGIRQVGKSGCELTWEFLSKDPIPTEVFLLGRYDVWDLDADSRILPFHWGLLGHETNPLKNMMIWESLLVTDSQLLSDIISEGLIIQKFKKQDNSFICETSAFPTTIDGYRVIALNSPFRGSLQFDSVWNPAIYDIMMVFNYSPNSKKWAGSLYTTKPDIDVSLIAQRFNGGGHKGASGFLVDSISEIIEITT